MEIFKWKWMMLGALGCMNTADFEKKLVKYILHIVSIDRKSVV